MAMTKKTENGEQPKSKSREMTVQDPHHHHQQQQQRQSPSSPLGGFRKRVGGSSTPPNGKRTPPRSPTTTATMMATVLLPPSPRLSPGFVAGLYAGCKFTEPPSAADLPLPPKDWVRADGTTVRFPCELMKIERPYDFTQQLKLLLKVQG